MLATMQPNGSSHNQLPPERSFASMSAAATAKRKAPEPDPLAAASKKRKTAKDASQPPPDTSFPAPSSSQQPATRKPRVPAPPAFASTSKAQSELVRLATQDTPVIDKNRTLRAEADKRRKASRSTRGKRASSSMGSGVISQPHPTVPTSVYHKHLPPDLPEALRARHLLMWCASWATNQAPSASSTKSQSKPLSTKDAKLAKDIQDEVMKLLAEGKLDTNVIGRGDRPQATPPANLAPHPQNVKNMKRKTDFITGITQAKAEDAAWSELTQEYKGRHSTIVSSLELQRDQLSRSQDKGKAKEREVSDWEPWDNELDDRWSEAATAARDSLRTNRQRRASVSGDSSRIRAQSPISARLKTLGFKSDKLHQTVTTASVLAEQVQGKLDAIFSNLGDTLKSRSVQYPAPPANAPPSSGMGKMIAGTSEPPGQDPILLLRGISRTDAARPDSQISAPIRRTRQSIATAPPDAGVAKYTAVSAPTPRRPPGTPRRTPRKAKDS